MTHPFIPKLDAFGGIEIHYAELNDFENNCYVVVDTATGATLVVDAADAAPYVLDLVEVAREHATAAGRPAIAPVAILTTHRHPDHWQALGDVKAALGVPTIAGDADADAIPVPTDRRVDHGDTVELGATTLELVGLRGHTAGSIAVVIRQAGEPTRILTGDSLFPGGIGKTDDDAQYERLLTDVVERLFRRFPDDTVFHPGHGLPSTIGRERGFLNRWRLIRDLPAQNPANDKHDPTLD